MARTRAAVLFIAVLLALSGCGAFFDFNAFSSLDKPGVPSPSRYQGPGGLANLQDDLSSPAIVDALKGSPSTVATILSNLDSEYGVTTTDPTNAAAQTAAILYSQLALATTGGDELVNNIVTTIIENPSGNLQSMLASIVPADVAGDLTKFTAMVNNLLAAEVVYIHLGNTLNPSNPPPGMNMGDVAQKAAVALLMKTIFDAATAQVGAGNEIADLFALINNQPSGGLDTVSITDPFANMGSGSPAWLVHIFDAAGAPYPG